MVDSASLLSQDTTWTDESVDQKDLAPSPLQYTKTGSEEPKAQEYPVRSPGTVLPTASIGVAPQPGLSGATASSSTSSSASALSRPSYLSSGSESMTSTLVDKPDQFWSDLGSGGQRAGPIYRRGLGRRFCGLSREEENDFQRVVERIIGYSFKQAWGSAILEEALESPCSGVVLVGKGEHTRQVQEGNKALARVGEALMRLVLKDQVYGFSYSEDRGNHVMKQILSQKRLYEIGCKFHELDGIGPRAIRQFIRGPKPLTEPHKQGLRKRLSMAKEEIKRSGTDANNNKYEIVERAIKALIGACFEDGGFAAARSVQFKLGLVILT